MLLNWLSKRVKKFTAYMVNRSLSMSSDAFRDIDIVYDPVCLTG